MTHPYYRGLRDEYLHLLSICRVTYEKNARAAATRIIKYKERFESVSKETGVPTVWIMAVAERESNCDLRKYLGNGQSLTRATTIEPIGRGPFDSWEDGCIDALRYMKEDQVKDWDWPRALYQGEEWNGFGPRNRGCHTGYLWSGTNIYTGGKFIRDHVWDADAQDGQLGMVPVMKALIQLDSSLDFTINSVIPKPKAIPSLGGDES